jgi:uncharacterized protein (TIGR02466 family)
MNVHSFFETVILAFDCDCDNQLIYNEVKQHQTNAESVQLSNAGGYQGHGFESETFSNLVTQLIPQRADKKLKSFDIQAWVNVNSQHHWNDIHTHNDDGVLISGIYYVSTPKNSGNIRFYDPRLIKGINPYDRYYYQGTGNYVSFEPRERKMLFFPPWLPHMVEPNISNEERISIAFNIVNVKFT